MIVGRLSPVLLALVIALTIVGRVQAATVVLVTSDAAGEGFNDHSAPDPASIAGGNYGATLGQQRRNAFLHAAKIWGSALVSPLTIEILALMDPLTCSSDEAVLGYAGPQTVHREFPGALVPWTWYPQALANALAGVDLGPEQEDAIAVFNSSFGTTCPFPNRWYYGLDGDSPADAVDFVSVVLHELTHGLGFLTLVDLATGEKFFGHDDAFMRHLEDHNTGLLFPSMTDGERAAASRNSGNLHWIGANVVAAGEFLRDGRHRSGHVEMYAPNPPQTGSSLSHFSNALAPNELMEPFFTGTIHTPGLAASLFEDIGWELNPFPSIRGNGVSTLLNMAEATVLSLTVSLIPGVQEMQPADWWVHARTPDGWYWWTLDAGWIRSDKAIPAYRGPLERLRSFALDDGISLQPGEYQVYFGVDLIENGVLDFEQLYYRKITVNVF
jgi:hypothetical protein